MPLLLNAMNQNRIDWDTLLEKVSHPGALWYNYFNNLYENQLFEMGIRKLA